jgi:CheY-like chemotaxis protein
VVVDDNEDSCQMLEVLLVSFGHVVETAYDGASGLELIRKAQPHVAILDIGLPVLTGYEVAERARAEDASLFLVALTGYGSSSDRERALAAGFDAHVVKPLRSEELHRVFADRFGLEASERA